MKILLLEDDLELGNALQRALDRSNLPTQWVRLTESARRLLAAETYALAALDIGIPDGSGLELLSWMRNQSITVPVIMLTARSEVADRVNALDAGADDYLPKPFALDEFLSRVRALIRRANGFSRRVLKVSDINIDIEARLVDQCGVKVELAPIEFSLLTELAGRQGRVLTRSFLEQALDMSPRIDSRAIEVHVHHLRRKLGPELIRTVRGVGYVIDRQRST